MKTALEIQTFICNTYILISIPIDNYSYYIKQIIKLEGI